MSEDDETSIIWAFGEQSRYAHAYCGRKSLEEGITLCGIRCLPVHILAGWDTGNPEMRAASCPKCIERLPFARFIALHTGRSAHAGAAR